MQKIVDCKLIINRIIDSKEEKSVIEGKGYYKDDNGELTVFFTSENSKYKYIYIDNILTVICNNSEYTFKENIKEKGIIKQGEYSLVLTTLASKIKVMPNRIVLNYSLYQEELIGMYYSELSFN